MILVEVTSALVWVNVGDRRGQGVVTAWTSVQYFCLCSGRLPSETVGSSLLPELLPVGETSRGHDSHLVIAVILFSHLISLNPYGQECCEEGLRLERVEVTTLGHAVEEQWRA